MVKKLKRQVRLITMIPMLLLILLISASFFYLNYNSIISNATSDINKYNTFAENRPNDGGRFRNKENEPPPDGVPGGQGSTAPAVPGEQNSTAPGTPGEQSNMAPGAHGEQNSTASGTSGGQGNTGPGNHGEQGNAVPGAPDRQGDTVANTAVSQENGDTSGTENSNNSSDADDTSASEDTDEYYDFSVSRNQLIYQSVDDERLAEIALSLCDGTEGNGIRNGYFYRVRKNGSGNYSVKLLKSDELYYDYVLSIVFAIAILLVGSALVVVISIVTSKIIIRPVAENIKKQKNFISDTSHELKTPLAVIEVNTDILESNIGENKWLKYVQNEITSMEQLISRLLLLSSVEDEDAESVYEEFDLSEKVDICTSVFEGSAFEKNITVKTNIEQGVRFKGSEYDIEHIISPLVDNAVKHTEKGGTVCVELTGGKNEAIIKVLNEGEPIPESEREKIFERFYRVDKARNRKEKRFGLGLAIVRSIAEKYCGKVEVSWENNMTCFKVTIKSK